MSDPFIRWLDKYNLNGDFFMGDYDKSEEIWRRYISSHSKCEECEKDETLNVRWYNKGKLEYDK